MKYVPTWITKRFPGFAEQLLLFCAVASAAVLAAALVAQYGFGLFPCDLCIYQRYPYLAVIFIGFAGALLPLPRATKAAMLALCAALFVTGAGIAGYHAGVEMGIFTGPSACSGSSSGGESLEELRRQIMEAPLVSCDQTMAELFGLSLAAWNLLIYLFLTLVASYGTIRSLRLKAT